MGNEHLWDAVTKLRDLRDEAAATMSEIGAAGFCDEALQVLSDEIDEALGFLASVRRKAAEMTKARRKRLRRAKKT